MHNKLAVTLVAAVISTSLAYMAESARSPAYFAAIAATIAAIHWALQYFQLGRQLQQLCFEKAPSAEDVS